MTGEMGRKGLICTYDCESACDFDARLARWYSGFGYSVARRNRTRPTAKGHGRHIQGDTHLIKVPDALRLNVVEDGMSFSLSFRVVGRWPGKSVFNSGFFPLFVFLLLCTMC